MEGKSNKKLLRLNPNLLQMIKSDVGKSASIYLSAVSLLSQMQIVHIFY